jgi:Fe-S cluster assembly scaffold protein SufB
VTTPTATSAQDRAEASPPARERPVRRGPADLPFRFADRGLAETLSAERSEPDWLGAARVAAWHAFIGLPVESNQLYTPYVDLRSADLFGAAPYVRTDSAPDGDGSVPEGAAALIELREDDVATLALSSEARDRGVTLESFGAALGRDPDGLRTDLEAGFLPDDDKLAQLVRGFWSQGVRLLVPDGVRIDRPIVIRWALGRPGRALVARTVVRLGAGASASIVEEQFSSMSGSDDPHAQSLFAGTTEVILGASSTLAVASIQDLPENVVAFSHRTSRIGDGATLHWALAQLGGRLVRSRVDNRLEGDRSSVEQAEIVFGAAGQLFDLTSYTTHIGRDTTGNLLAKGALRDDSRSFMKGLISIERSAIGTDSFLGEFGMNLGRKARAVAIPSLEIDQPDCRRAMHSSSVGPIDETQVFYLESRGIPLDDARKFIVLGFLEPVVARVPLAEAQDRLRGLLDAKWGTSQPTSVAAA